MIRVTMITLAMSGAAHADTVIAARTLLDGQVIAATDLAVAPGDVLGTFSDPRAAIGQKASGQIHAGRPIGPTDVQPTMTVERNAIVTLRYQSGGLNLTAEGRTLEQGTAGQVIRVMNLGSRNTLLGTVAENGEILVKGNL